MSWTPERVSQLKVLWAQGLTCSQIATALNKLPGPSMSRMAVIGKRVRLGLPDRMTVRNFRSGEKRGAPNRPIPKLRAKPQPSIERAPDAPRTRGAAPGDWNLKFSQAMGRPVCKRFVADESGTDGLVCGTPAQGSWCSNCRGSIFAPLRLASAA